MRYIHIHRARRIAPCIAAALALQAYPTRLLRAHTPAPPLTSAPSIAAYRAATIALVQPERGTTIPRDKPVIVLRSAPGEPADPIDTRSFSVHVNGTDRPTLFQATTSEAWGPDTAVGWQRARAGAAPDHEPDLLRRRPVHFNQRDGHGSGRCYEPG